MIELGVNPSTFYRWYQRHQVYGYEGLKNRDKGPQRVWNRIPEEERENIVRIALEKPEMSSRQLAWYITDTTETYISESSVYRILQTYDLITSPAFTLISASDKFKHPTYRVNELWQTDFTYFKITGWGWYFLGSILDDYSRYIITWKLFKTMSKEDVMELLEDAQKKTGVSQLNVKHKPRLLSDNGPCYQAKELEEYLSDCKIEHTRGAAYHPQTQGKIERFHRSIKNVIKLEHYYYPWDLEHQIRNYIEYYNNHRYHESLNNVTPADMFFGRYHQIETRREKIKKLTLEKRKKLNLKTVV